MFNDLISIVVPVFNVEKYLEECVNSLLQQTYLNIEIILVDDGSTDSSGFICDELKNKDDRVKVIHKKNGGLSDARNYGIGISNGKYISFVDSDDIVPTTFIEILYKALIKYDTKMSVCGLQRFSNVNEIIPFEPDEISIRCETTKSVLEHVFYQDQQDIYSIAACGKLYKKELFINIQFPLGRLNEDMAVITDLMMNCRNIAVVSKPIYYYRINTNSITMKKFSSQRMDAIIFSFKIISDLNNFYPDIVNSAKVLLFSRSCELLTIARYTSLSNEFKAEKKVLTKLIKEYRKDVLLDSKARVQARCAALISFFNISLVTLILKNVRRIRYK